jgi:hypothetical protein
MRRTSRLVAISSRFAWLVILLLGVGGCGTQGLSHEEALTTNPTAPTISGIVAGDENAPASEGGFYPLEIGNRWRYRLVVRLAITTNQGPQPPIVLRGHRTATLIGDEVHAGHRYVIDEERTLAPGSSEPVVQTFLYRQDRSGLYAGFFPEPGAVIHGTPAAASAPDRFAAALRQAGDAYVDRTVDVRAGREAFRLAVTRMVERLGAARPDDAAQDRRRGGPLENEITVLRYPLHTGAHWIVSPTISQTVKGLDVLQLPAGRFVGWRLREHAAILGPHDVVRVWYGAAGYLKLAVHFEAPVTDDSGNVIGSVIGEQRELLAALGLRGHGRSDRPVAFEPSR